MHSRNRNRSIRQRKNSSETHNDNTGSPLHRSHNHAFLCLLCVCVCVPAAWAAPLPSLALANTLSLTSVRSTPTPPTQPNSFHTNTLPSRPTQAANEIRANGIVVVFFDECNQGGGGGGRFAGAGAAGAGGGGIKDGGCGVVCGLYGCPEAVGTVGGSGMRACVRAPIHPPPVLIDRLIDRFDSIRSLIEIRCHHHLNIHTHIPTHSLSNV